MQLFGTFALPPTDNKERGRDREVDTDKDRQTDRQTDRVVSYENTDVGGDLFFAFAVSCQD